MVPITQHVIPLCRIAFIVSELDVRGTFGKGVLLSGVDVDEKGLSLTAKERRELEKMDVLATSEGAGVRPNTGRTRQLFENGKGKNGCHRS